MRFKRWKGAIVLAACFTAGLAAADVGHDEAPKVSAATDNAPRSEAQTELFELVATTGNGQLILFLDRYASNEPIIGAKMEVESGNWKAIAPDAGDGSYRVKAPQLAQPGRYPLLLTVQAGANADLIETTLVVAEAAKPQAAAHAQGAGWMRWSVGAAIFVAVATLVGLALLRKRRRAGRSSLTPKQGNRT